MPPPDLDDSDAGVSALKDQAVTGMLWNFGGHFLRVFLQFAFGVLLARLLAPEAFGLLAMVMVFSGFAQLFCELGLAAAIIQKRDLDERHLSSIFWFNLGAGGILTLAFVLLAPALASFYRQPRLAPLVAAVSPVFVFSALVIVQHSLLTRRLAFKKLFFAESAAVLVSGAVAVLLALHGFGVWSLVCQTLLMAALQGAFLWFQGRWRPRAVFDWGALREILPFSLHLFGFNMVNYWMANLDNLLVGKVLSSHALGIYSRAYSLMLLPVTHLTRVIARVMFPVMSRLQGQESLSQRSYLKATRLIAFFSFPLMLGLLVGADLFVGVIYGPRWLPVIPILRIFCLIGMVHSVGSTTGWIYTSSGRTDIQFRWGLFVGVTRMAAIVVGLRWGLRGVAIAYAVATYAILWAPSWMIAGRIIGLRFRRMTANLAPSLGCALIMTLALQLLRRPLAALPSSPLQLLLLAASGAVLYIALNHFFRVGTWKELLSLAREVKSGRRRERERHER